MFGTSCVVVQHTFVCIYMYVNMFTNILKKKHVNMLAYEVDLKLIKYTLSVLYGGLIGVWVRYCLVSYPSKEELTIYDAGRRLTKAPILIQIGGSKSICQKELFIRIWLYRKDPLVCGLPAERLIYHCLFIFVYFERT